MAPRKVDFALAARAAVTQFAESVERIAEIDAIFTDSGYDSGGSNPIVDDDLTGHDMTAAQIAPDWDTKPMSPAWGMPTTNVVLMGVCVSMVPIQLGPTMRMSCFRAT